MDIKYIFAMFLEDIKWFISTLVQVSIFFVVLKYTFETWRLRKHNAEQLKLFRDQIRLTVVPFLVLKISRMHSWEIEQIKQRSVEGREEGFEKPEEKYQEFAARIYNPAAKVARDVYVFVYDNQEGGFLECEHVKEVLPEKEWVEFRLFRSYKDISAIREKIIALYGSDCEFMFNHIIVDQTSYIATCFRDFEGTLYLLKRVFDIDTDRDQHYAPAELYEA